MENIPKDEVQKTTSAQTEFADIQFCTVCEYPAEDLFDLGEHMCEFHSEGYENKISWHYCDDTFDTKDSLSFFLYCSAWSKSKSKEQNFGFGPKQNTKVTLKQPPTHPPPPKTFKEVPGNVGFQIFAGAPKKK